MMVRKLRRHVINLGLFIFALCVVIYLNLDSSDKDGLYEWTAVKYRSRSATSPSARGICPGLKHAVKPALVVARVAADGNSSWLDALTHKYHMCVYNMDAVVDEQSNHLQVPGNHGHESMAYLTFLIDNYADIPAAGAVFVHGNRFQWHNDHPTYDNAALLSQLNLTAALAPHGYHNLRCDWSASTCPLDSGPPQGSLETSMNAVVEPWNARVVSDSMLPRALASLFGEGTSGEKLHLGRSATVRSQCCAQFVVSRSNIWAHARDEYVGLRQWLIDGNSPSATAKERKAGTVAPADDRISGRVLSYVWHILWLSPGTPVHLDTLNEKACPRADECYCRLYNRCDLMPCRQPGSCEGQYTPPPNLRLPLNWAAEHS